MVCYLFCTSAKCALSLVDEDHYEDFHYWHQIYSQAWNGCSSPTETLFQSDRSASISLLMTARKEKASSWHISISKREGEHRDHYKITVPIIKNSLSLTLSLPGGGLTACKNSSTVKTSLAKLSFFFFLCNVKLLFNPVHHCQCFRQRYHTEERLCGIAPAAPAPLSLFHRKSL